MHWLIIVPKNFANESDESKGCWESEAGGAIVRLILLSEQPILSHHGGYSHKKLFQNPRSSRNGGRGTVAKLAFAEEGQIHTRFHPRQRPVFFHQLNMFRSSESDVKFTQM
jgi:hypothetical protein